MSDKFESGVDLIEVTNQCRPDPSWRYRDAAGHEHRWWTNGQIAGFYNPSAQYQTPTLRWIKDGEEFWEDDDVPHSVGHLECRECGEYIRPGYTADTMRRYIPGLPWYRINGQVVTEEEYQRRIMLPSGT